MKVYGKVCHYGELEPGDVLIEHKRSGTPSDLITHAAVVAQVLEEGKPPWIFHLTGWGGLALDQIYKTNSTCWSGYRLNIEGIGETVLNIAMRWLHNNASLENMDYISEAGITVPGVYDTPSLLMAFFGRSSYGYKARQYADYLNRYCWEDPPDTLCPHTGNFFSGAICSYLPIALYQTTLGTDSEMYMAIDAKRTLPRALVKYFDSNSHWQNFDIPW